MSGSEVTSRELCMGQRGGAGRYVRVRGDEQEGISGTEVTSKKVCRGQR